MNDDTGAGLPPLSDATIERMERTVFDTVEDEPRTDRATTAPHRVRRRWVTGLGVAAAFVVGAMISPALLNLGTGVSNESMPAVGAGADRQAVAEQEAADAAASDGDASDSSAGGASMDETATESIATDREIITTSDISLLVTDVSASATKIAEIADDVDGYVESSEIGGYAQPDESVAVPVEDGVGWVSIRVPAAELSTVTARLSELGEVTRSSTSRQDVTSISVDLRARIDAAQTSVDRLTELLAKSGSVSDLVAAESALAERQAQLEAYQQELKMLDEQVALSTVSVQLTERTTVADADPAGFSDGLLAGWNGLVATLNGLVIALGFILPWLAIAAVVVLVIWLIRRRTQRGQSVEDR